MNQFVEFFYNHLALFGALGLVLSAFIANEVVGAIKGAKKIGALEAVRLINDRDPIIVDVRPAADFKRGHLLNAQHVALAKVEETVPQLSKDKSQPVIVYCALGGTSSLAAQNLMKIGYTAVHPIRGGINAWLSANLPVTTK